MDFTLNPDPHKPKGPAPKGVLAVGISATRPSFLEKGFDVWVPDPSVFWKGRGLEFTAIHDKNANSPLRAWIENQRRPTSQTECFPKRVGVKSAEQFPSQRLRSAQSLNHPTRKPCRSDR